MHHASLTPISDSHVFTLLTQVIPHLTSFHRCFAAPDACQPLPSFTPSTTDHAEHGHDEHNRTRAVRVKLRKGAAGWPGACRRPGGRRQCGRVQCLATTKRTAQARLRLEHYGQAAPCVGCGVSYVQDSSTARLVALLRRQALLVEIMAGKQESIALCEAIAQGCCRRVERISLERIFMGRESLTSEQEILLAAALEAKGALSALKTLQVHQFLSHGGLIALSRALQVGTDTLTFAAVTSKSTTKLRMLSQIWWRRVPAFPGARGLRTLT